MKNGVAGGGNIYNNLFRKPLVGSKFSICGTYAGLCSVGGTKISYGCEVLFPTQVDEE